MTQPERLPRDGYDLAYCRRKGGRPGGVLWLGGFMSDMTGTKATALDAWAAETGETFLRFDYFGHGASGGAFVDGTISRWRDDAVAVLDRLTEGPQVLVGSSMGGWIATLLALARPERVSGIVYIAPAPDFTEELMWKNLPEPARRQILEEGVWHRPSEYDDGPYPITRALIEDGRRHLVLGGPIAIDCPVAVLQGMADPDVPWAHAMRLVAALRTQDVTVTLTKSGDHRLSGEADLARLIATVAAMRARTV
ncbi:MAG: alpha/beta fold hydrolase [Alphaproteobacteria bacterium]|nr:alpha/beta fold hydrolase [Alphaproteobacteria bacterium]